MRLRRFEFGIATSGGDRTTVYARRRDGALFVKEFRATPSDLLADAKKDFEASPSSWSFVRPTTDGRGLSLVFDAPRVHVSGEAAITAEALFAEQIRVIVSLDDLSSEARAEIERYASATSGVIHVDAPMLDVVARHQTPASAANARLALAAATQAMHEDSPVLIHCLMGVHRSVAVASVALTRAGACEQPRDAYLRIQERRPLARWMPESIAWLESLYPAEAHL